MKLTKLLRPRGLALRMAGLLTLAILPVGIMSLLQSQQIAEQAARRQESSLLALTSEAAASEAQAIANARGLVSGLSALVAEAVEAPQAPPNGCSELFERIIREEGMFSFAGFIDVNGTIQCGSAGVGTDVSDGPSFTAMSARPVPQVVSNSLGPISGESIMISTGPVVRDGEYMGYVAVSIPHNNLRNLPFVGETPQPLDLLVFNYDGELISSESDRETVMDELPVDRDPAQMASRVQYALTGYDRTGDRRTFAVVPIVPGEVFAMGIWPAERFTWDLVSPYVFPFLMLLAGWIGAVFAVWKLVIRHIRNLRRNMEFFSDHREIRPLASDGRLSIEFEEIDQAWTELAHRLLMDEAELEGMVREKNVLLKEVHHRVKNNLQLIASIVNMKLRRSTTVEAHNALKDVQGRVMSIAAVHRALYSNPSSGQVRADELLKNVIDATLQAVMPSDWNIDIESHYEPVGLYPDQAVPLLLLAAEAVTNSLKYMGRLPDGSARLSIDLRNLPDGLARLTVSNTCGVQLMPADQVTGSGLGKSLMQGFALQIGGGCLIKESDVGHTFSVDFSPAPFDAEQQVPDIKDNHD